MTTQEAELTSSPLVLTAFNTLVEPQPHFLGQPFFHRQKLDDNHASPTPLQ